MIKVNLCPIDELENQYWYVPDLVVLVLVGIMAFAGVNYYHDGLREEMDKLTAEQQSKTESINKLMPDLERFKNLGSEISELDSKVKALQAITVSRVAKYKSLIVLEHLHNLKPDGVWLNSLRIGSEGKKSDAPVGAPALNPEKMEDDETFEINGQAYDNILTAEYITAIRSTGSQDADAADPRTLIYFSDLDLKQAEIGKPQGSGDFAEMSKFPSFILNGHFAERPATKLPLKQNNTAPTAVSDPPYLDEDAMRLGDLRKIQEDRNF
jgi:hypothetical protein